jgi:hypothetical protein
LRRELEAKSQNSPTKKPDAHTTLQLQLVRGKTPRDLPIAGRILARRLHLGVTISALRRLFQAPPFSAHPLEQIEIACDARRTNLPGNAMIWIAPSEKDTASAARVSSLSAPQGERDGVRCWSSDAAEQAGPASHFAKTEYNVARQEGLLGLIFLRFTKFAAASLERITALQTQIQNLRRTRGLLLPRLLLGRVNLGEN